MVMKSAVDDDDTGWGLGIPEKMKNNANWVDITHEFKGACKGKAMLVIVFVCVFLYARPLWKLDKSMVYLLPFHDAELNLGELLHDKL